ncbi:hypothetical protein [Streptomyces sp. NPDC055400]
MHEVDEGEVVEAFGTELAQGLHIGVDRGDRDGGKARGEADDQLPAAAEDRGAALGE